MNDLEVKVLDLIGENPSSPDVFDNTTGILEIRSHLNDAIEEIFMLSGARRRTYPIPLKANARFYQLPESDYADRFGWFESVWLVSSARVLEQTSLDAMDYQDERWLERTGTPTHYAPISWNKFAIFPAVSTSADSLEVTAVAIPQRYTLDTDRIRLRKSYEWAAVNRAVSEFWATRGDAQSAARYFQTYAQEIGYPQMYPEQYERRWSYRTNKEAR